MDSPAPLTDQNPPSDASPVLSDIEQARIKQEETKTFIIIIGGVIIGLLIMGWLAMAAIFAPVCSHGC
jgi:hypothetical protein